MGGSNWSLVHLLLPARGGILSAPRLTLGAECALVQAYVLHHIGGRAYRGHIDPDLRLLLMRDRAGHGQQRLSRLALAASAVAGYLLEVGDDFGSARWGEMAADLSALAGNSGRERMTFTMQPWDDRGGEHLLAALVAARRKAS
jgi:hypothetical protein